MADEHLEPKKLRVMCFVESDNGFGHFNIINQIAKHFGEKGGEVAVASGTFFHPGEKFEFEDVTKYHLPPVLWDRAKQKDVNPTNGAPYSEEIHYQQRRISAVLEACQQFQPDVVMFELYPFMMHYRNYEAKALDEYYKNNPPRPAFVTLCRDIIHSNYGGTVLDTLNNIFDHVLIRGDGILNTLEDCQPEWGKIKHPIEYMGNIVSDMPVKDLIPDAERPVVVFSGGGYHDMDKKFFKSSILARSQSKLFSKNPWRIYVSDNCKESTFNELVEFAERTVPDGSVQILRPVGNEDFRKELSNCASAIVRGSYNTTFELASVGIPFVVVPRPLGVHREQIMRAEGLESKGLAKHFPQNELDNIPKLADTLDMASISKATCLVKLDYNGAEHTADRLIQIAQQVRTRNQEGTPDTSITEAKGSELDPRRRQKS